MRPKQFWGEQAGATAVEFALTSPVFMMVIIGLMECGMLMWTQIGLQHGVEMAARCASINPAICGDVKSTQNYAAEQAFGLGPPPEAFSIATQPCGVEVSASYPFQFVAGYFGVPQISLSAKSCFPK